MNKNFITIANFTYESEMLILLAKLESENIRCFTSNRTIISIDPLLSNALGGIKLMVHQDDLDKSLEILKEFNMNQTINIRLDVIYHNVRFRKTIGFCPICDENTIYKEKVNIKSLILQFFLLKKRKFFCIRCKHEWEE